MKTRNFRIHYGLLLLALLVVQPMMSQSPRTTRREERLAREIRHELIMLPFYSIFDHLEYIVDGDVITLRGHVTRPTLKSSAEKIVSQIEGVTKVINVIELLPLSPNDDRIRYDVYNALFSRDSTLFRYSMGAVPPIHIIVNNGNVTLVGFVDSEADKQIATSRARRVSGVFTVTNKLTISEG